MPERRGRRHRNRDRRDKAAPPSGPSARSPAAAPVKTPASPPPAAQPAVPLPSRNARLSGFAIALITLFLAILLIADAFSGSKGTPEMWGRIIAGVLLVGLALFVGALVLFPAQIRDFLQRRYDRKNAANAR